MARAPLSTIRELGRENGASTTRRKVLAAVRDANTGRLRVASQTKQNKTKLLHHRLRPPVPLLCVIGSPDLLPTPLLRPSAVCVDCLTMPKPLP